ncbi:MAG TPA: choice-of-anchor tandem repeat GloVer-containing protein [Terriglobales bacterium]|nr:choice-of-anchor tandem repeat GloVer-containing protein [Terriglobales bacterium]
MRFSRLDLIAVVLLLCSGTLFAGNESVLHGFNGGGDGSYPVAGLIADRSGNLYGTTRYGGANGQGIVFELSKSNGAWNEAILYSFAGGNDGASPAASVVMDAKGNIYGTTRLGGPDNAGTVFGLQLVDGTWQESILWAFTGGDDGGAPQNALTLVGSALIGTAPQGGTHGNGVVFGLQQVNGEWREEVLYSFAGGSGDGAYPYSQLVLDKAGNIYGTAESGGPNQEGSVFELSRSHGTWTETTLHFFTGNSDGASPNNGVIFDKAGNLYGMTQSGGKYTSGTIFELSPSNGSWTESILYNFTGGNDGGFPAAGVTIDPNGNLFGSTFNGGKQGFGTVFQLTPSAGAWTETVLYSFTGGSDGALPQSNLLFGRNVVIGTATEGGPNNTGVVFSVGRLQSVPSYCKPCLFYGGDFDITSPAADTFANENIYPGGFQTLSQIYSPFTVPAGETWSVTGLFINSIAYPTGLDPVATPWEIRTGIPIGGGSGGTLLASGANNATMTPTGRSLNGTPEYTIEVTWNTPVILQPGTYWENVTPQCTDLNNQQCIAQGFTGFLESDSETMYGLNGWGPPEPWQDSFWNAPDFGLFWANTFQVHQQRGEPGGDAFSAGVIGTR